jgi:hypothetical protein
MRNILTVISTIVFVLIFAGCGAAKKAPVPSNLEGPMYTQHNIWEDVKATVWSTNYPRGIMIPVNTEVEITGYNAKFVYFKIAGQDREIRIRNAQKFTLLNSEDLAARYFGITKVNLSNKRGKIKQAIKSGLITNGMTKEEVIIARGYPPSHRTPSLKENTWIYWQNRYVTKKVEFKNNKVVYFTP